MASQPTEHDRRAAGRHALFPGTFDPPTLGHIALIERASRLFDSVTVAVAQHPTKRAMFSVEERRGLLESCTAGLTGVRIEHVDGLTVEGCRRLGCSVIVRGVRSGTDFDYEVTLARNNRTLLPTVDTVLLVPDPGLAHITSGIVREVASLGGDPSTKVPVPVAEALRAKLQNG